MPYNKVVSMHTLEIPKYKTISTLVFVISLVLPNAALQFFTADQILDRIPLHCPLNFWLQLLCPTCGLGHSLFFAWTGNLSLSLSHHPFGLIIFSISILVLILVWCVPLQKIQNEYVRFRKVTSSFEARVLGIFALLLYCTWGFLRNF